MAASDWILLTNDDGVDSPALPPLARALEALGEVRVVAPSGERSWIGKAISRHAPIRAESVERAGRALTAVDGTPADCVQLAVHELFDAPPRLVVSGINLGLNVTLGFFLSSGTAGAAMEGRLCGIPALAFSTGVLGDDRGWRQRMETPAADGRSPWHDAAALCAELTAQVDRHGLPDGADLLNVNFAAGAGPATPRRVTGIAPVSYGALFRRNGDDGSWRHDFRGRFAAAAPLPADSDLAAIEAGRVSITPVSLVPGVAVSGEVRARFESPTERPR